MDETAHTPAPRDERVPAAGLPARIYASKLIHRLVPARVAFALAERLGPAVRKRRNPVEGWEAESFMKDLLLYTPRAAEADELAERWLVEKSLAGELLWRPWLLKRSRILGREHWDAAHPGGRGCLIVIGHFAPHWAVSTILARHDLEHHAVAHRHHWDPLPPGYLGLMKLHRRREYIEKPLGRERVILSDAPPERFVELLEAKRTVLIAFDVAGSASTPFLGRSVALAGGPPIVLERPEAVELAWSPSPLVTETPPAAVPSA